MSKKTKVKKPTSNTRTIAKREAQRSKEQQEQRQARLLLIEKVQAVLEFGTKSDMKVIEFMAAGAYRALESQGKLYRAKGRAS